MDDELIDYCIEKNLSYRILSIEEIERVRNIIEKLYQRTTNYGFSLFDMLKFDEMKFLPYDESCESWRCIHSFIENKRIIVFFYYKAKNEKYIELLNGDCFIAFYENAGLHEFYIMDPNGAFLLGYNHSNCLFAMGDAADWLEKDDNYISFYS